MIPVFFFGEQNYVIDRLYKRSCILRIEMGFLCLHMYKCMPSKIEKIVLHIIDILGGYGEKRRYVIFLWLVEDKLLS